MRNFEFISPTWRPLVCSRPAIVAISIKNEAERLPACLNAIAQQTTLLGRSFSRHEIGILVFANNCDDDSAKIARRMAADSPFEIRVVEAELPPAMAHAGGARRAAMDLALAWLVEWRAFDGVILSTDGDSQAAPDWVAANLEAFAKGAEAVLGNISLDEEGERLSATVHARGKLEAVYEALLAELSAWLDPQDCNAWPHHATISGASLGVTRRIYERIGGLPPVPAGEDKALVAVLRRHDARIRFAPDARVVTSARISGRAPGGVADALRLRSAEPEAPCDEALERCLVAYRRALWRGRLRREGFARDERWVASLGLPADVESLARSSQTFGAAWEAIEAASPALARQPLVPADLPRQIALATRLLGKLNGKSPAREDVEPILGLALAADEVGERL